MKDQNLAAPPKRPPAKPVALHYAGYDDDRGGIVSVVRALATTDRFDCVLGVNPGFAERRQPPLARLELPAIAGETINWGTFWRARTVARAVRAWLRADPRRIFHAQSRAGMLVAWWLRWQGEQRFVVIVQCYGHQRWFYRWIAAQLAGHIYWLTPAMKTYYGVGPATWDGCVPNSLPGSPQLAGKLPRTPGRLVVGGIGMLVRWKGWHLMIEALALLPAKLRAQVEFRHIGAAAETEESAAYARGLIDLAAQRGVSAQVSWLGWQPSSAGLLAESDCLLVASDHEPCSMAALEALFAGVPVIAADTGGPKDFIVEGRSGWFFKTGEARDLARVLALLLAGEAFASVRIDPAELQRFHVSVVAEQWAAVYARLLAGP